MIKLLFVACLSVTPDYEECKPREVPLFSETMTACYLGAQVYFAMLTAKEPGLRIGSWRCADGEDV